MGEQYKVIDMDTSYKWWDRWFVVANQKIDKLLEDYNYFSLNSVYLITPSCSLKQEFLVRKPRVNLKGIWSKCNIITMIDNFGGLLTEVEKICGNDIFAVTQDKVIDPDEVERQKIYVFFAVGHQEDANKIESYLNENNYTFIMADDVPFGV